jgi:hypothetical protein
MTRRAAIGRTWIQALALTMLSFAALPARPAPTAAAAVELRGAFRTPGQPETLRLRTGPNDTPGWERLTKLVAEIDGATVHAMAASSIRVAGICRATATGLDQVLLSFRREPGGRGGAGVLLYDAPRRKFTVEFLRDDITQRPGEAFECAAGRTLFPDSPTAAPCLCPWADTPLGRKRSVR